jgi:ankyrin repeat protein
MSGGDWKDMYKGASEGDLSLVQYHVSNGVDPDYQHPEILSTPLVTSIIAGHDHIALFLISSGVASLTLRSDFDDLTPLEAALKYKRSEILKALSDRGVVAEASFLKKVLRFFLRKPLAI